MSFQATSTDITLDSDHHTLRAKCVKSDGRTTQDSTLDLDTCIGNINGDFQWGKKDYSLTAKNVALDGDELSADLTKEDGTTIRTGAVIHLGDRIENDNGTLKFT
ncbi:hypothetical protein DL767_000014 [Monosporascus sp. MG133]|nr:hypothetical protein DL767_000014 [Monosporascus sp. MG133]